MRNLYVSEAAYNRSDITYYTMVLTVYKEGRATVNTHVISKLVDDDTCPVVTKLHSSQLDPDDSRRQILILKCARMYPHIMCPLSLSFSLSRERAAAGDAHIRAPASTQSIIVRTFVCALLFATTGSPPAKYLPLFISFSVSFSLGTTRIRESV